MRKDTPRLDKTIALQIKATKALHPEANYKDIAKTFGDVVTHWAVRKICIGNIHSDLPSIDTKAQAAAILNGKAAHIVEQLKAASAVRQAENPARDRRLTDELALAIRAAWVATGDSFAAVAKRFDDVCTASALRKVCHGEIYSHVPMVESKEQAGLILAAWENGDALALDAIDPVLTHRGRVTKFRRSTVIAIRAAEGTQREIAARFGLACSTVSDIRNRKMFANVD